MPGQKWCGIGLDIPTVFLSLQKSLCGRSHLICGVLSSFLLLKILFLFLCSVVPSPFIPHLPYPTVLLILFKLSTFSLLVLIKFVGLTCRYGVCFVSIGPSYEKQSVVGTPFSLPFIRTSALKSVHTCSIYPHVFVPKLPRGGVLVYQSKPWTNITHIVPCQVDWSWWSESLSVDITWLELRNIPCSNALFFFVQLPNNFGVLFICSAHATFK